MEEKKENAVTESQPTAENTAVDESKAPVSATPSETPVTQAEPLKEDSVAGDYHAKPVSANPQAALFSPIAYVNDGTRTIDEDIEKLSKTYLGKLNHSRLSDFLCMGLMILAFVGVILVTFLNKSTDLAWVTYLVLGLALAIIIGSFVVSTFTNKKRTKVSQEYLAAYEDMTNGYFFSSQDLVNPTLCASATLEDQLIIQAHYFRTINSIQSRAVVEATRKDHAFIVGEAAVTIPAVTFEIATKRPEDYLDLDGNKTSAKPAPEEPVDRTRSSDFTTVDFAVANGRDYTDKQDAKRVKDEAKAKKKNPETNETSTGLFGKFISYEMTVSSKEAFIVCFLGEKNSTVLPDYLTGFNAILVPGLRSNIVVYATDIQASKVFFTKENVDILNKLYPDMSVQSAFLSVNSYGTKIGLTLCDEVMSVPYRNLKAVGMYDSVKNAIDTLMAFVDKVDEEKAKN